MSSPSKPILFVQPARRRNAGVLVGQTLARYGNARRGAPFSAAPHEGGTSICNRNRIMTGVRFVFRVTLRRHDLAAEMWHIKEPQKLLRGSDYDRDTQIGVIANSSRHGMILPSLSLLGFPSAGR
jgi:hypothetical protein